MNHGAANQMVQALEKNSPPEVGWYLAATISTSFGLQLQGL